MRPSARVLGRVARHDIHEDRIAAPGDRGHFEDVVRRAAGHVSGVLAERPFGLAGPRQQPALDDDFGVGRHQHIHGAAAAEAQRLAQQRAGQVVFILADAQLGRAGQHHRRMRADHHCDLQVTPRQLGAAVVIPGVLAAVDAGAHPPRSLHLEPHVGQVAHAGVGVARRDHPRGDVRAGILDEVARDRQLVQVGRVPFPDDLLGRAGFDHLRRNQGVQLLAQHLDERIRRRADAGGQHFARGEQVRHQPQLVTRNALEQEHGTTPPAFQLQGTPARSSVVQGHFAGDGQHLLRHGRPEIGQKSAQVGVHDCFPFKRKRFNFVTWLQAAGPISDADDADTVGLRGRLFQKTSLPIASFAPLRFSSLSASSASSA